MEQPEIGIVDTRNILKLINDLYHYDFSDYALMSLKRRIEHSILLHNMKFADMLGTRLKEDKTFFDLFLHEILVESTEFFRDPSLWRLLRDEFFPENIKPGGTYKIWLPHCVSGDELFTMCIVLEECGLANNVSITAGYTSDASLTIMQSGATKKSKLEIGAENYKRYQGKLAFENYFSGEASHQLKKMDLVKKVIYKKHDLLLEEIPKGMDLVIFRNKMIYHNQNLSDKISGVLWESLNPSGHLILGIKEQLSNSNPARFFRLVNEHESIYQKR